MSLTSTQKAGEPCLGDRYQGAKPPAGVWGTLSGGQVIPSQLLSLLCPTPQEASYEWMSEIQLRHGMISAKELLQNLKRGKDTDNR